MRLKGIEIKGFKSFLNQTRIDFKSGITAIVGPNGSGKSNISDAIRWVLGEQSIKTLRGSKMEDVIFAGTNKRKPLGYAEVTIIFDNSSGLIPIEYSEVAITRRVFRSGESEFFINKNACRLRDIKELLMDTGIGKEGYSIIGQGRIDEILSNNSQERRGIFEEAAGIIKYKAKKEEALRKLRRTDDNLLRIDDLLAELKSQETSLKRQSTKAKEFKEIYEILKGMEINLILDHILKSREKYTGLDNLSKEIEEKLLKIEKDYSGLELDLDGLSGKISKKEEDLNRDNTSYLDINKEIDKHKSDLSLLLEKKKYNEADLKRLEEEKLKLLASLEDIKSNKFLDEDLLKEKSQELKDLQEDFLRASEISNKLVNEIEKLRDFIESSKDKTIEMYNNISDKRSELNGIVSFSKNMGERFGQLEKYINEENNKLASLEKQLGEEKLLKEEKENILKNKLDKSSKVNTKTIQLENQLEDLNISLNKLNINMEKNLSNYNLYKKMEESYEGYYKGVRNILRASEKDESIKLGLEGVVADLIKVEKKYELAINTGLGSSSQFIVTRDQKAAKHIIDYLYKTKGGRVTCLPLDKIKGRSMEINLGDRKEFKVLGLASELVSFDGAYKDIVENLLGKTIVVETMDNAIGLSNKYKNTLRIVTLKGNIINPGGSMTGGSQNQASLNILSRKNEIDRILEEVKEDKALKEIYLNQREDLILEIKKSKIIYSNSLEEIKQVELENLDFSNRIKTLEEEIFRLRSNVNNNILELESLKSSEEEYKNRQKDLEEEVYSLETDLAGLKESIGQRTLELSQKIELRDEGLNKLTEKKIEINKEKNKLENLESKINENSVKLEELEASIRLNILKQKEFMEIIENSSKAITNTRKEIENKSIKVKEISSNLDILNSSLKELQEEFESLNLKKDQFFKLKEEEKEKLNSIQIEKVKEEMTLKSYEEELFNKYGTSYEDALSYRDPSINIIEIKPRIKEYRDRITRLGNVNLSSIEEYEILSERLGFIIEQKEDMLEAKKDLEEVISKMEKTMKEIFKKSFDEINSNFKLIFKTLFNGGEANLFLEDSKDVLNSGIDIEARPPGKKLQNLSSLSGGERSLVAVSLLFAILKMKPSPFCILDEIDAALDEANIGRYTSYLQDIGENTQFIMITHRKRTMEMADILYGITMEEEGVSKLISVELKDYKEAN